MTAPAAQAIAPGQLLAIMGTSTCHVLNGEQLADVPGMCGVVDGGIVPGLWGYEAGQSGVGDIFGWFVENAVPPRYHDEARARGVDLHEYLSELAGRQAVGEHGLIALDWHSGNRSVLVDHALSGLILGLTLRSRAEDVYRALIEATAFGTRRILERVRGVGRARARVLRRRRPAAQRGRDADLRRRDPMPLHLIGSEQGPALGSAIHAAVAAGAYPDVHAAAAKMGRVRRDAFTPDPARADAYDALYEHYLALHDHFGRGGDDVMHALRRLRPRELVHG